MSAISRLIAYDREYRIPDALIKHWEDMNGADLLLAFYHQRRLNRLRACMFIVVFVLLASWALYFLCLFDIVQIPFIPEKTLFAFLLGGMAFSGLAGFILNPRFEESRFEVKHLEPRVATFLQDLEAVHPWLKGPLTMLRRKSKEELREIATEILAVGAAAVLKSQDGQKEKELARGGEPDESMFEEKRHELEAFEAFKAKLGVLHRLGIAKEEYGPYFERGRRRLEAIRGPLPNAS